MHLGRLLDLGVASGNVVLRKYVRGAILCKFDLSFGPVPVIGYPPDFMSAEQLNKIAMRSMLRLSAAQGKTTVTLSTFDEMGIMELGILGRLPTVGFYALVVFLDINVPKFVSDSIEKVESLLVNMNSKIPQEDAALNSFVKQVFIEIQELVDQIAKASNVDEREWSKELEDGIGNMANRIKLVIDDYHTLGLPLHKQLADNCIEVTRNLILLSVKHNRHLIVQSLVDLLIQLERMRYQRTG
jgi:hypothetical protein